MIIYDLNCDNGHRFEGWFRSADEFEAQLAQHLVCCPKCDSHDVRRVPSAVAIGGHKPVHQEKSSASSAVMPVGAQVSALYEKLVKAMIDNSEDVGTAFAEEARKIYYKESPERPIRGEASQDECDALREEGIPVLRLPSIKEEDLN